MLIHEARPEVASSRIFDVLESLLRYLSACTAAGQLSTRDELGARFLLSERASLGQLNQWMQGVLLGPPAAKEPAALGTLRALFQSHAPGKGLRRNLDELIAARNRTRGHGVTLGAKESERLCSVLRPLLDSLLQDLGPFFTWRPVVIRSIAHFDGVEYILEALLAIGDNPLFASTTFPSRSSAPLGQVFLHHQDHALLPLYPLLHFEGCERCGSHHLFLFHAGSERQPRYLDSTTGHSYSSPITVSSMLASVQRLSGPGRDIAGSPTRRDPDPPSMLAGRYRIDKELGHGSSGKVYLGFDQSSGTNVAIKILRELSTDVQGSPDVVPPEASFGQRFEREIEIMRDLDHPHVVRALDAGESAGLRFLVMEFVTGASLRNLIQRGPVPLEESLRIADELLSALEAAHLRGIVHRDLKPENVLLTGDGSVRVTDFGVARIVGGPSLTRTGELIGTAGYMSPEQVDGNEVDSRSDLFAVGVLLYELLTSARPFVGPTFRETLAAIIRCSPVRPSRVQPELPDWIDQPVLALLAREPSERPANATAARALLRDASHGSAAQVKASSLDRFPEDVAGTIARLGERATALLDGLESSWALSDSTLEALSQLLADCSRALQSIPETAAGDDSTAILVREGAVRSLLGIAREIERACGRPGDFTDGAGDSAREALQLRFRNALVAPAEARLLRLEEESVRLREIQSGFISFDAGPSASASSTLPDDWKELMLSDGALERHDGASQICRCGPLALREALHSCSPDEARRIGELLWHHAPLFLLEMRSRAREVFQLAESIADDESRIFLWRLLSGLFRAQSGLSVDPVLLEMEIASCERGDQRSLCRSLLLHPNPGFRAVGLRFVEPSDVWEVVASESVPLGTLLEIWLALNPRASTSFRKVFFVCTRDRIRSAALPVELNPSLRFLEEFYGVDAFHEGPFFRMIVALDEFIRPEARRFGTLIDFEERYAQRLKDFLAGGVRRENPVEAWSAIPLPVQRLLARRGYFLRHFITHPNDPIALECLPHLVCLENVASYVAVPAINSHLLQELAKESRLFQWEEPRYALVANPKTPGFVLMKFLSVLRRDSLKRLSMSHEVNQLARQMAIKMLGRAQ